MTTKVKEKHERFGYLPSTVEMKDISYFLLLICLKMNDMIRDKQRETNEPVAQTAG